MKTQRKPRAAAIYARISDDTEGRAAGVTRQVEDAHKLIEREGWSLGPWKPFIDNDISASTRSKARRPEFDRMIELVEAGEIDGIAFYSNSRLTRRPREFEDIIDLVERTHVQLASYTSGRADLSTADGRQLARMLAAVDAAEAERIGERVTRAFVQRRDEGRPNPSSRAFGFERGGEKVIPVEAALIREAANRITEQGWSLGMVVKDWNERKIPTVRGAGGWSRTTLRRTLTNPRTAGLVSLGGEVIGKATTFEAIISREQQKQIEEALKGARNGSTVTFKQRKHWLAGFLVCGRCDRPMKVNALYAEDGSFRKDSYIVCSRSQYGCGNVKRNLLHVMDYVDEVVKARIELAEPTGDGGVEDALNAQAAEVEARLVEIEEDIADLQESFRGGGIRFKDYNTSLAALRNLQEITEEALSDLKAERTIDPSIDLMATWVNGTVEEKREVMEWAIDHIRLMPIGKVGPTRSKEMVPDTTRIEPRRRG